MPRKTLNRRRSRKSKRSRKSRRNKKRSYKMRGGYGNCVYQVLKNSLWFCNKYDLIRTNKDIFLRRVKNISASELGNKKGDGILKDIFYLNVLNRCPGGPLSDENPTPIVYPTENEVNQQNPLTEDEMNRSNNIFNQLQ